MKRLNKILCLAGLLASLLVVITIIALPVSRAAAYAGYPTLSILAVVRDQTVSIQTYNLPANENFDVRMGIYGNLGWGYYVMTIDSGGGGSRKYEFSIPAQLAGQERIAIRIDSSPATGYYAYNWFWNSTAPVSTTPQPTAVPGTPTPPGYSGYPYFYITSVERNGTVTIDAYNFPPNDKFDVTMNLYGTLGIGGYVVESVTTDAQGKLAKLTFSIPSQLDNLDRIAILLRSPTSGYYAFNWFWNY